MAIMVVPRPKPASPRILHGWPPEWIRTFATVELGANVRSVFTYGDTVYVPSGDPLPVDVLAHEAVHQCQQGQDPDAWWQRYFADVPFRLEQELAAYRRQYADFAVRHTYKVERVRFLAQLTASLSGPLYGGIVSADVAAALITGRRAS